MKLRLRDNSVRLRLSRSEVYAVAEGRVVEAGVTFGGGGRLGYLLECSEGGDQVTARFERSREGTTIAVRVPIAMARTWASTETVALHATVPTDTAAGDLKILIEKDFACLSTTPRGEDESDMFPHPEAGSAKPHC